MRLELSDRKFHEPQIRARLGTAAHLCEVVVLKLRTVQIGTAPTHISRAAPIGTVLNLRTTTSRKCAVLPRRARI